LNDHQDCETQPEDSADPIRSTHQKTSLSI
jgi:hypothetical protein